MGSRVANCLGHTGRTAAVNRVGKGRVKSDETVNARLKEANGREGKGARES